MPKVESATFFIVGGAGFVGSNMVEELMKRGARVVVYDNLSSGNYDFIKQYESNKEFRFIKADILDTKTLNDSIKESHPDTVIHLAANPDIRLSNIKTDLDLQQGTIGTYNVLEAMRLNDVKRFIFSSSSAVYGSIKVLPTPEDAGPLQPISLYGASKLACEGLVTAFSHLYGMDYYMFRFGNVIGKNLTHSVVIDLIAKLKKSGNKSMEVLGNGQQRKSFIEVSDIVNGILYVYTNSTERENLYNLTTDDQLSVKDIAEMIVDKLAKDAEIKYTGTTQGWPGDVVNAYLSNAKLKALGWKPTMSSREAMSKGIDLYAKRVYGS